MPKTDLYDMGDQNVEARAYLHSKCHGDSPTWAYLQGDEIVLECSECEKELERFKLATPFGCLCDECVNKRLN